MSLQFASLLFGALLIFLSQPFGMIYSIGAGLLINSLILYSIVLMHGYHAMKAGKKHEHRPSERHMVEAKPTHKKLNRIPLDEHGNHDENMTQEDNIKIMKSLIVRKYIEHLEELNIIIGISKDYYESDEIQSQIGTVSDSFDSLKNDTIGLIECIGEHLEQEMSDDTITKQLMERDNESK